VPWRCNTPGGLRLEPDRSAAWAGWSDRPGTPSNPGLQSETPSGATAVLFTCRTTALASWKAFYWASPQCSPSDQPPGQTETCQQRRRTRLQPDRAPAEAGPGAWLRPISSYGPRARSWSACHRIEQAGLGQSHVTATIWRAAPALELSLAELSGPGRPPSKLESHCGWRSSLPRSAVYCVLKNPASTATARLLLILWGRSPGSLVPRAEGPPRWGRAGWTIRGWGSRSRCG